MRNLLLSDEVLHRVSFVAVSTYCMYRKTLNQLLEFVKALEKDKEEVGEGGDAVEHVKKYYLSRRSYGRRKANGGGYRRSSASLPDMSVIPCHGGEVEEKRNPFGAH